MREATNELLQDYFEKLPVGTVLVSHKNVQPGEDPEVLSEEIVTISEKNADGYFDERKLTYREYQIELINDHLKQFNIKGLQEVQHHLEILSNVEMYRKDSDK